VGWRPRLFMFIRFADGNVLARHRLPRKISGLTADSKGAISTQMAERLRENMSNRDRPVWEPSAANWRL
jgi:hypothetical protein